MAFPIHLDIPVSSADTNGVKSVQSLKQSIEANLENGILRELNKNFIINKKTETVQFEQSLFF